MPIFSPPYEVDLATTVSRADRTWSPPGNRLFRHYFPRGPVGRTVLREGGVWKTVQTPTSDRVNGADLITDTYGQRVPGVFLGGHLYPVTSAIQSELVAAGYGAWIIA